MVDRRTIRAGRRKALPAVLTAGLLLVAGAAPVAAQSASAMAPSLTTEPVTLVVEDVSGTNRDAVLEQLNADFMAAHPNVTIDRVRSSFTDLQPKQAIELAGPNPPDVVEIVVPNDTFGKLGNQGLLTNLDPYVEQYGWTDRFPASLLDQGRFDSSGQILSGPHYGVYMVEDVVGIFYNKAKLAALGLEIPTTWEEFQASLEVAKQGGEIPIMLGNLEKWPVGHVYAAIYNRYATTEDINGWTFNTKPDVTWEAPGFLKATQELQAWGQAGYFTPDYNAVGYDDAVARFRDGEGLYLPAGTWVTGTVKEGENVGFFLAPPLSTDPQLRTQGGQGQFWAISGKSENPDVAAAYLDMLTSQRAGELLVGNSDTPGFTMETIPPIDPGLYQEVFAAIQDVNANYTVSTYEGATTATMLNTEGEGMQKLLDGQMTPEELVAAIQADHDAAYKP